MAYAALLSLSNTIQLILSYDGDSISAPAKDQIISIAESVNSLQAFLEDFPEEARRRFEAIIMAVTHEAEDIIEFFISSHIYEPRHASVEAESLEVFVSEARLREGGNLSLSLSLNLVSHEFVLESVLYEYVYEKIVIL